MTNPELADRILEILLEDESPKYIRPTAIAERLNEDLGIVEHTILEMMDRQRWLKKMKAFGENNFEVVRLLSAQEEMRKWLSLGGYTTENQFKIIAQKEKEASDKIDREYKLIGIAYGKQALEDSKEALRIAHESFELSKKADARAEQSANESGRSMEIAEHSLKASRQNYRAFILVAIVCVLLTWILTRYFS